MADLYGKLGPVDVQAIIDSLIGAPATQAPANSFNAQVDKMFPKGNADQLGELFSVPSADLNLMGQPLPKRQF